MPPPAERVRRWQWHGAAAVVALAVLALVFLHAARQPTHRDFTLYYYGGVVERHGSYTDIGRVLAAARAAHHPTYQFPAFGPATLMALVFQPLSLLGYHAALAVWLGVTAAVIAVALWRAGGTWWPLWILLALAFGGMRVGLTEAQPSLLFDALQVLALALLLEGKDRAGGAVLGAAVVFKLYPAFLVLPLLAHRRWQAVVSAAAVVVAVAVVSIPALGLHDVSPAVTSTRQAASVGLGNPTSHNQSVPGVVLRAAEHETPARVVYAILLVAGAVLLLRGRLPLGAMLALAVPVMLLVQSLSWEHYFPALLFTLIWLSARARSLPQWAAIAAAVGLLVVARSVSFLGTTGPVALVNAPSMLGAALLAVTVAWVAWRPGRSTRASAATAASTSALA